MKVKGSAIMLLRLLAAEEGDSVNCVDVGGIACGFKKTYKW